LVWIKFIFCLLIIFFTGRKVAKYGDIIAERSGLGGAWIGLVLLASLTSLPELFTGVSAVTLVDAPDLTIGNVLGANMFNMFNLALLDIAHRNSSLLAVVSRTHQLTGMLSLLLILVAAISIFISNNYCTMGMGWLGWYSPVIILLYLIFVRIIFLFERRQVAPKAAVPVYEVKPRERIYLPFAISSVFIIGAGIWLPFIGDEIAQAYGWGQSFVGSLFLAFTTTLPELTVSFAAMRIGANDMAVANMIGSNLFNLTIIPIDDLLYTKMPILAAVSGSHLLIAATVMLMTVIFIATLHFKPGRFIRLSWGTFTLIVLFFLGAYFSFTMA